MAWYACFNTVSDGSLPQHIDIMDGIMIIAAVKQASGSHPYSSVSTSRDLFKHHFPAVSM